MPIGREPGCKFFHGDAARFPRLVWNEIVVAGMCGVSSGTSVKAGVCIDKASLLIVLERTIIMLSLR